MVSFMRVLLDGVYRKSDDCDIETIDCLLACLLLASS